MQSLSEMAVSLEVVVGSWYDIGSNYVAAAVGMKCEVVLMQLHDSES